MSHRDPRDHAEKAPRAFHAQVRRRLGGIISSCVVGVIQAFIPALAQTLPYAAAGQNLGVVNCANSLCHGSVSPWKDSNILQNEYVTWSRVDKHATRAYHVLLEERSQRIARNLGLKEPAHQAKLCL